MSGRSGRRGSVRQEANASWSFIVDVADGVGQRRQTRRRGYPSRRAPQSAMTALLAELDRGVYVAPTRPTVADYLVKEWLPAVTSTVRPSTFDSYTRVLRIHVIALPIGRTPLQDVDGPKLNALYAHLLKPKPDGHGLSLRSVQYVHTILHRAFRDAIRWDRMFRNPCDAADPPRGVSRPRLRVWTASELSNFLDVASDDRLIALWHLLATTGMRRGEALGLQWDDLNLEASRLSIKRTLIQIANYNKDGTDWALGTPKTRSGFRQVEIDPRTVAVLRAHRAQQAEERLRLGTDYLTNDFVFTRVDGRPLHPKLVSQQFRRLVARFELPTLSVHGLRHTWATLALQAGIHPKIVQERLGHAQISVTLDTYSHVTPAMDRAAATTVAALLDR
jgi:integrase